MSREVMNYKFGEERKKKFSNFPRKTENLFPSSFFLQLESAREFMNELERDFPIVKVCAVS